MLTNLFVIGAIALTTINGQTTSFTFKETYPEAGVVPTAKPEWLNLLKNATITNAPVYKVSPGQGPQPQTQGDPYCDWTFTGCFGKEDLYQCPKGQWAPTYDDGPSEFSAKLYDELDKTNTKATFFMVGGQVHKFPELVQRAYKSGHEIAMHTWSHSYMTSLTNEQIVAELKWNEQVIKEVTGVSPRFFRPPYGDIDNRVRDVAKALGFSAVIWTHDTNDWALTENPNFKASWIDGNVTKWASEAASSPNGGVSLEHDLYNVTVDAAVRVLPTFLKTWKVTTVGACNQQISYKEGAGTSVSATNATTSAAPSSSASSKPNTPSNSVASPSGVESAQSQTSKSGAVAINASIFGLGLASIVATALAL
ncbi:uncharacterized protein BX664DRAFT_291731 [Halteromyces radiatus]|uniref:uncharacterized protein n=1 Tax=Halteromyces radiatus TaxID=101107 RepID=UPI0022206B60|nr:uncharacterized protein BX664DRAFT_291731 [Halteromyces radiatus]KAI8096696.1 hypothetical protein BX664DRAFT_291731 [Halteromyces radiatus]